MSRSPRRLLIRFDEDGGFSVFEVRGRRIFARAWSKGRGTFGLWRLTP